FGGKAFGKRAGASGLELGRILVLALLLFGVEVKRGFGEAGNWVGYGSKNRRLGAELLHWSWARGLELESLAFSTGLGTGLGISGYLEPGLEL
ncbi:Hypothetical predicted protein, partial [Prunus dulcis]